ncbi:MAG TPA: GrpB family protein [Gemmatimonadaceae bacterium]
MTLGLESGTVRLVPYDPAWPVLFAAESERLRTLFSSSGLIARLEHTGSTAIPGLMAKPILDVLAGYPGDAPLEQYIVVLVTAGYAHRGESGIPGREFFRRGEPRSHHVHLTAIGSQFWRDHLAFRNRLRADNYLRDAYAALKHGLAARFPRDREAYIDGKASFVKAVLKRSNL